MITAKIPLVLYIGWQYRKNILLAINRASRLLFFVLVCEAKPKAYYPVASLAWMPSPRYCALTGVDVSESSVGRVIFTASRNL
jgi:hypothetical protein